MSYKDQEKKKRAQQIYYQTHKEQAQVYRRAYYQANKERHRQLNKAWYQANMGKVQRDNHASYLKRKESLTTEVFQAYGGPICVCCGENHIEFLTIDHIGGGGSIHRRQINKRGIYVYAWLKKHSYPDGFRVLCMNCNFSLGRSGHCPHSQP